MGTAFQTAHLPKSGKHQTIHYLYNYHLWTSRQFAELADAITVSLKPSTDVDTENLRLRKVMLYMASNVIAAFAIEAAMNYRLGDKKFWDEDCERSSYRVKLRMLASMLDWDQKTFDDIRGKIKQIFDFRNDMAHSKRGQMVIVQEINAIEWESRVQRGKKVIDDPKWMKLCTPGMAKKFIQIAQEFINLVIPPDKADRFAEAGYTEKHKMLGIPDKSAEGT